MLHVMIEAFILHVFRFFFRTKFSIVEDSTQKIPLLITFLSAIGMPWPPEYSAQTQKHVGYVLQPFQENLGAGF